MLKNERIHNLASFIVTEFLAIKEIKNTIAAACLLFVVVNSFTFISIISIDKAPPNFALLYDNYGKYSRVHCQG